MEYRDPVLQNGNVITKTLRYLKKNGVKSCAWKIYRKLFQLEKIGYERWRRQTRLRPAQLRRQRQEHFALRPFFSILVPLYRTRSEHLKRLIQSICAQTYTGWELCLAEGSEDGGACAEQVLAILRSISAAGKGELLQCDGEWLLRLRGESSEAKARIRLRVLKKNEGIAGNTNAALEMAEGDYILLLDHDDFLSEDALYELTKGINEEGADFLYSDEDKVDAKGTRFFDPHFKPDFNPDLLLSMNYICHLTAVRTQLARQVGGFSQEFDGAQDYDFILRCTEVAERICHIPRVLYHWRSHESSTAADPQSKAYAFEAGKRAIRAQLERRGLKAEVLSGASEGLYHVRYQRPYDPLVSVLIPSRDHVEDLRRCMESLDRQSYPKREILILENGSTEEETLRYYEELARRSDVRILTWDKPFHYSDINNFGASQAKGEYLLLLNNDAEWISEDGLEELLGYGMRPDTGIVGARLFYGDDTIQHAGVILGLGGLAGHAFTGLPREERSYMWRAWCTQNYSAVTAACLLVRKAVFDEVGGFCEELAYAFNDVDFCLRVREAGYLVVYNSEALLYHYESKSRGLEDTPEKVARFNRELYYCRRRWEAFLRKGDPYYNSNLTLEWQDFSCKSRAELRAGLLREEQMMSGGL